MVTIGTIKRFLKTTTILGALQFPAVALASEVTLQSSDGTLKFVGELIEFKDGKYILSTNLGDIAIGAEGVVCEGEACPTIEAPAEEVAAAESTPADFKGGPVSLQSFDGALKFEGNLIAIENGNYIVRTQLGDLQIATDSVTCVGGGCPQVVVESLEPTETVPENIKIDADDPRVTLTSFDGNLKFVGDLIEVTNGKYVIKTNLGELRVSASTVKCEGPACPTIGSQIIEVDSADSTESNTRDDTPIEISFTISGPDLIGSKMMPLLISGYAASKGAVVEVTDSADQDGKVASLISDGGNGERMGSYLIAPASSQRAIQDLGNGQSQIAMSARHALPSEVASFSVAGAGDLVSADQEHLIALDNLVIVTHPDNPIGQISMDSLGAIYGGIITDWAQVGGQGGSIKVVSQGAGSDSRDFFEDHVFEGRGTASGSNQAVAESAADVVAMIKDDPSAIGYVSYASLDGLKPLSLVSECGITSSPDAFSAKTEEYSLGRRLYLYNRADNLNADAKQILDFATSEEADALIAQAGLVNLDVARRVQSSSDARVAALQNTKFPNTEAGVVNAMLDAIGKYDRLSTTFRFGTGSARLDEKARGELPRLVQYLKDLPTGSDVVLVGFADSVGAFGRNQSLSVTRANQARSEVEAAARNGELNDLNIKVMGFGEIAPSSCNDTDGGRALNRRVEIWVSK
ncbi:Phosphate-binding protein PstS [Aliiroseovarius pelagivivens]|uniref:Phosphate-binding protein PstS n=1 Tax=Aliiroseovarius pelagivivens TaxID=1639690 RepID=A0A2R8AJR1_9RHOB|nr:phosphate ABC transporter substrate-binding/OmpA family protein [Aliiroseovarius pelagivivens]SPF76107.1 Phosphate-binding protein PstS [Aliiroseovarius pelagivivens]